MLTALVEAKNDRTPEELGTLYKAETAVRVTRSSLWRALKRVGLVRKKVRDPRRTEPRGCRGCSGCIS